MRPKNPPPSRVLITGATAAMVRTLLESMAGDGVALALAVRNEKKGRALAAHLTAKGAPVAAVIPFEATLPGSAHAAYDEALQRLGGLDGLIVAHGELVDQSVLEHDNDAAAASLHVNGTSAIEFVMRSARTFEDQGHGRIAGITSGAGERGRRSTYGYGTGKAMLTTCLQGVRARLHRSGIPVLTIVPCFVDTPMTARLPRNLRYIPADVAGHRIYRAFLRGQDTLHIPGWWRLALFAARNTPEWIWKRSRTEEKLADRLPPQKRS